MRSRPPDVRDEDDIGKIHDVEPTIKDEPAGTPVSGHKVRIRGRGECEGVEEEEGEYNGEREEDAPPQIAIHLSLGGLLALVEIFHGCIQRVESPDVEGR